MNARRLACACWSPSCSSAACSGPGATGSAGRPPPSPRRPQRTRRVAAAVELTVYGAASLKGALEAAKAAYKTAAPGVVTDDRH